MNDDEIEFDEDMIPLIPAYLENRKKDISAFKIALAAKDLSTISNINHRIQGTALNYGQVKLDRKAKDLYSAIASNNWDDIEAAINEMELIISMSNSNSFN